MFPYLFPNLTPTLNPSPYSPWLLNLFAYSYIWLYPFIATFTLYKSFTNAMSGCSLSYKPKFIYLISSCPGVKWSFITYPVSFVLAVIGYNPVLLSVDVCLFLSML